MKKKLVIKFWKAEKALVMQILEQEGLPTYKNEGRVWITSYPSFCVNIQLRGSYKDCDLGITHRIFSTNSKRDAYLDNAIKAITDELFAGTGDLKVGEYCEVSDNEDYWNTGKLLAILPEEYNERYIVSPCEYHWISFKKARPLTKRTEPKVKENGEIITYTWEEE